MKSHSSQKQGDLSYLVLASLIVAVCGLIGFAGCVTMGTATRESLLKQAGFQARTPTTEKQKAAYAALPAYQLQRATKGGKVTYAYKDEKAGVVYTGNHAQYQQFQQLAAKANIKKEDQMVHGMDEDLIYRWYGSWQNLEQDDVTGTW
jgi:hypothetical protein